MAEESFVNGNIIGFMNVKVRMEERGKGYGQLLTEKLLQIVCERNVRV